MEPPDDPVLPAQARSHFLAEADGLWPASVRTTEIDPVTGRTLDSDRAGNELPHWVSSLHGGGPDRHPVTDRPTRWPFD